MFCELPAVKFDPIWPGMQSVVRYPFSVCETYPSTADRGFKAALPAFCSQFWDYSAARMTGRPHRPPSPGLRPPLIVERVLYPSVLLLFRSISKDVSALSLCSVVQFVV